MTVVRISLLLFLGTLAIAQSNVYCLRVIGHTPFYERIFLPKGHLLRPSTLRGLDDLKPTTPYPETNRIDRLFADVSRERTNGFFTSCLSEIPTDKTRLRCPGDLLASEQVREFLRDTMVVPRSSWTNHMAQSSSTRYVYSLVNSQSGDIVIDMRDGRCGVVFFPDDTYRCIMDGNYSCLKKPKDDTGSQHYTN